MRTHRKFAAMLLLVILIVTLATTAFAAEMPQEEASREAIAETEDSTVSSKAYAAAIAIGITAACGALAMGMVGSKAVESISRQPEAEGKIRTALMLGLVFIETAVIYALLVVILIIFVL